MTLGTRSLWLCLCIPFGIGCAFNPYLSSYPITDGFQQVLPPQNSRIVVWGEHPTVSGTVITWLQKQGMKIIERAKLKQIFEEQNIRLTHTPDEE